MPSRRVPRLLCENAATVRGAVLTLTIVLVTGCTGAPERPAPPFADVARDLDDALRTKVIAPDGGVPSYLRAGVQLDPSEAGVGLERTSESAGLLMVHAIQRQDRDLYVRARTFYERTLRASTHLAYWKVDADGRPSRNDDGSVSSAPIDELRIGRALDAGARAFRDPPSRTLLREQAVALRAAIRNGVLAEDVSWDPHPPKPSDGVLTAYLDIAAMRVLAEIEPAWQDAIAGSRAVMLRAAAARPPWTAYDPASQAWSCDNGTCGTIPVLWLALHLLDAGERDAAASIATWYTDLIDRTGLLPGEMDATGTRGEDQDLASYALLARLHARLGYSARAADIVREHLLPRRVTTGALRGLFTFEAPDAPSFDNLTIAITLAELAGRRPAAD